MIKLVGLITKLIRESNDNRTTKWQICWVIRKRKIRRTLQKQTIARLKFNKLSCYKSRTKIILLKVVFWKNPHQLILINNKWIKLFRKVIWKNPHLWVGMFLLLWFLWLGRGERGLMDKRIEYELFNGK